MGAKTRGGAGAVSLLTALALVLFNNPPKREIEALCVAIFVCAVYGLSGWVSKKGLTVAERMGHGVALVIVCSGVVVWYGSFFWPSWKLTGEQKSTLASFSRSLPAEDTFVIELPQSDELGQQFGHDLMSVFADNGARVNKITVLHGVGADPVGTVILIPEQENCPAYRYGTQMATVLNGSGITAHMFPQSGPGMADCNSFVILVGTKPRED